MTARTVKRVALWVLASVAVVFVGVQFVTVERTNPAVALEVDAPPEVSTILRRSCYDCHSHETRWPWYSRVAPLSWWLTDHVEHGRRDLNFSDWPAFDPLEQAIAFEDIEEQLERGEMPLTSYTILHRDARLSDADRAVLLEWVRSGSVSRQP